MKSKIHLLYVEDDESLAFVTQDSLELEGYQITHCADGITALSQIESSSFDLCILDVMLPGIDGFSLAKKIREKDDQTPIIFLTAKSLQEDKIKGLKLGGDDYLTKPFSIEELLLKIKIFLRRSSNISESEKNNFQIGRFTFDYDNLVLQASGEQANTLTQREADLLKYFAERQNQVIKRSEILIAIWGEDDYFLGRSLDVFISRLRKYLKPDSNLKIENIHGVGFKLTSP